ncbi:MAG: TonB-dependent receptor [Rhodothermales bacterium]
MTSPFLRRRHRFRQLAYRFLVVLGLGLGCTLPGWSQETEAADSLKSYDLAEIVIGGASRREDPRRRAHRVELADLARQDVADVASTLRLLPAASVQTNSRGETLVYIRAAGERQVAVFLDGAPLNIAWDNRIDLSMVPSAVVGAMTIERGAVSPGYGTNTSGGTLNLLSRSLASDGNLAELTLQSGSGGSRQIRGLYAVRRTGVGLLVGGTVARREGIHRPAGSSLPFEPLSSLRTNTDRDLATVYLRLDREGARGRIGLTMMHASASKGIAPEGHLDPGMDRVRYWRYPLWRHSMVILNGAADVVGARLTGSAWVSQFRQDIEEYTSVMYRTVTSVQEDTDRGAGMRLILENGFPFGRWRLITVLAAAEHGQLERELAPLQRVVPEDRYANVLHTLGGEITSGTGYPGHWAAGVSWDGMRTPVTGRYPGTGGFDALALNAEWHRRIGRKATLKLNGGSKPRFPTMRELFGTALDRFILNPNLKPERTWMLEGGWHRAGERWQAEAIGFLQRTTDTIDQENVTVDGVRKRQRVNLGGSRVVGVEWQAAGDLGAKAGFQGHLTWLRPLAIEEDGTKRHLTEKPEVLGTVLVHLRPLRGIRIDMSAIHTGRAYGLATDNSLVVLPAAWRFGARLTTQRYFADSGLFLQTYAGVDNVFDALHVPQLGLPDAGRTVRFGMSLAR